MRLSENRPSALQSEAFILLPDTVQDLEDFVSRPERYLVSLYAAPDGPPSCGASD
jgi:hypothetical protein